jgi:predicted dehydrogenase
MKTRVAVIGVGALGRHHARILAALPDAELAGVVDVNEARAMEIGGLVNAPAFANAADMLGRVDAVTIAVPTESHLRVAIPFLQQPNPHR